MLVNDFALKVSVIPVSVKVYSIPVKVLSTETLCEKTHCVKRQAFILIIDNMHAYIKT